MNNLIDSYIFVPTEYLDFTIINDFMTIEELQDISMLNKHFYKTSKKQIKKQIKKLLDFSEKLDNIIILKNNSFIWSSIYENDNVLNHINDFILDNLQNNQREILPYVNENKKTQYNPFYWYNLFGKALNPQELALYYVYFICNYHMTSSKTEITRDIPNIMISKWNCVSYENGYIKSLAGMDNSYSISNNKNEKEKYLLFKKITTFESGYNDYKESEYDIIIENNDSFQKSFTIDVKLLKSVYRYIKKNGSFTQDMRRYTYPSIKDAIINIYNYVEIQNV